jgi:hypothetical protein
MKRCLFAVVAFIVLGTNAHASSHHFYHHHYQHHAARGAALSRHASNSYGRGEVVAHPSGCPRTLFCGCGAAHEVGLSDRSLWLAGNWRKFPRAAAAPGMAAVWGTRHVAIIRETHGDGTATVYDANSGGGLTRVHRVSLAGLTIVDPHGTGGGSAIASSSPTRHASRYASVRHAARYAAAHRYSRVRYAGGGKWSGRGYYAYVPRGAWREANAHSGGFWH